MRRVLVMLSASPARVRACWPHLMQHFDASELTVYVRAHESAAFEDLLAGCAVRSDKPSRGRRAFVRELRRERFDVACLLRCGEREYWQSEALCWLARAREWRVYDDAGSASSTLSRAWPRLLGHRTDRPRAHSALGWWLLPRTLALGYRATLGRALGALVTLSRYALRC